jgi:AcrR family transcriptional regulator
MPKETFFNLPEAKRKAILDAALEEFAAYPYDQASVNRIVARAGIPKGSFYQYFENKKDLYLYLLQQSGEVKFAYLTPILNDPAGRDFFTLLRDLYAAGIQFAVENPRDAALGKRLMASRGTPIYAEVMEANTAAASEFFESLLRAAIEQGEVRADIDVPMFAYLIAGMNTLLLEYYLEYVSQDYDDRLIATVDQFIDFLKHGLAPLITEY